MVRAEVSEGSVARRLRKIKAWRDERDALKKKAASIEKDIETETEQVLEEMQAIGVHSMDIVDTEGQRFGVSPTVRNYCRITDTPGFLEWCGANDVDPMMAYAVNAQKLNAVYRERDEHGESLPEGVEPYTKTSFTFRKKAAK